MKKTFKVFFAIVLGLVLCLGGAKAQEPQIKFHIIGPEETLGVGAEFPLKIVLDTDNPVNAYQVALGFNSENLEVLNTNDAGSIIDIMRDQPEVYEDGRVTFSGASLNSFEGDDGLLLTLNFRVLKEGVSELNFLESFVYLANGKGTKIRVLSGVGTVVSKEGVAVTKDAMIVDDAPPSVLNLSIVDDPINEKQKLLGFVVKDNSAGVKQTFIQYRKWLTWSDEEIAQNPMAIPKNVWAVKFRALDNTGNISEKVVYDWKAFLYYDLLVFVIAILTLGVVINRTFKRKRV